MKRHLKGYGAPKAWLIQRKKVSFIAKPRPGPHKISESFTLNFILTRMLKLARTSKEVKLILNQKKVLVDNIPRLDERFPVGLMDALAIPSADLYFRIIYSETGKLILHPIKKEDAGIKPSKIIGKTILRKNKLQINLYDGTNILLDKQDYKVGDTLIIQNKKIKKHLPLKEGATIYLTGGKYIGQTGKLKEILPFKGLAKDKVIITLGKEDVGTSKDYIFVIDEALVK